MADIHGRTDKKFERVADAFTRCFDEYGDVGASVCVTVEGEMVVDLWGGIANLETELPWQEDTLAVIFSASKGLMAICAHKLADTGRLDLDAPIADYWPEYGKNGKENITLRQVMAHTAGVPFLDAELPPGSWGDWQAIVKACEEQTPEWEPGSTLGYHSVTFGWIVGEVVRRISGVTPGEFLANEIAGPLGAECYLGLPKSKHGLVAKWVMGQSEPGEKETSTSPDSSPAMARANAAAFMHGFDDMNTPEFWSAQVPAVSACSNARGLATIYRPLALGGAYDGVTLLSQQAVNAARELQADGHDAILQTDNGHRATGFKLMAGDMGEGFGKNSFGHGGFGGHISCADPDKRISFGYVMNRSWPGERGTDPRADSLIAAAYKCIEAS